MVGGIVGKVAEDPIEPEDHVDSKEFSDQLKTVLDRALTDVERGTAKKRKNFSENGGRPKQR